MERFDGLSDMAEVWRASKGERQGAGVVCLMADGTRLQWTRCRTAVDSAVVPMCCQTAGQHGSCRAAGHV
jgi:hypothetical protein